ncbi:MAG: hypothetical protein EA408_12765 [Marinilabiliales bacterium]|nr:MAG: hypothetical protein EA408_12765 [Marinilabiliales bacterium]
MMDKKNIRALIHLLDDPDAEVSDVVSGNLLELGAEIIPELESAWEKTADHEHQEKIENIIRDIQFRSLKHDLEKWHSHGAFDLLEGVCLLARYQYPDLETDEVRKEIKSISDAIWIELNNRLTALEKVRIINHVIYDIKKFSKNRKHLNSPRNTYINLVLESKKGNPVTLSILYILVAQNLELPVYGVSLPKIFLTAWVDRAGKKRAAEAPPEVLFYINPYQNGSVLGRKEIDLYLGQQKIEPRAHYYQPCDNRTIAERLLLSMILAYEKAGFQDKTADLKELLRIFRPG